MNIEKKLIAACFAGATVGAFLALEFNHYFWWLGILLGGLVGYLSYGPVALWRALGAAWEVLTEEAHKEFPHIKKFLRKAKKTFVEVLGALVSVVLYIFTGFTWFLLFQYKTILVLSDTSGIFAMGVVSLLVGIPLLMSYTVLITNSANNNEELKKKFDKMSLEKFLFLFLLHTNVLTVLLWYLPKALIWMFRNSPRLISFLWALGVRFVKRVFILIHSEMRLLCMTDAALGAIIGYFCGNALIGGIAGALLGILNYKLISVRLLKLAPA